MADPKEEVVKNHQALRDYTLPIINNQATFSIRRPTIEANNFEIKPATI